jgi:hypothetical protein
MTMTATAWKVLASHNAFDHRWYVVRRDILQLPDGTIVDDYFVSVRPDVVVVVAVNRSGDMVMVRQHKHGVREAWAVGNARVEPKGNAIVITKQASGTAKIDPLMAAFNAIAWMVANPVSAQPSIFWI